MVRWRRVTRQAGSGGFVPCFPPALLPYHLTFRADRLSDKWRGPGGGKSSVAVLFLWRERLRAIAASRVGTGRMAKGGTRLHPRGAARDRPETLQSPPPVKA